MAAHETTAGEPADRSGRIQSVDRAVSLLRAVATMPAGDATLAGLAAECGLNRSTAWRLLATLEDHGLVERRDGPAALVIVLLVGAFGGAAAHTAVQLATGDGVALIGASASVAALIGWSLRQIRDRRGFGHLDQAVTIYGLFFIGFNLIGILAFNDSPIAYAAHAGGFVAGWFYGGLAKTPRARF